MNATLTLIMYWSIALLLVIGGIYALRKGFNLVTFEFAHQNSSSSIEFFGLKASVNSIGALVMVTAFMWGWAVKLTLPGYDDGSTRIAYLEQELSQKSEVLAAAENRNHELLALNNNLKKSHCEIEQTLQSLKAPDENYSINVKKLNEIAQIQTRTLASAEIALRSKNMEAVKAGLLEGKEATEQLLQLISKSSNK